MNICFINSHFLAKLNFTLFCVVNVLSKFQGPSATSGLKIRFYNFEGLIISWRYNFGPMSTLIGQLLQFWLHSSVDICQFVPVWLVKYHFHKVFSLQESEGRSWAFLDKSLCSMLYSVHKQHDTMWNTYKNIAIWFEMEKS